MRCWDKTSLASFQPIGSTNSRRYSSALNAVSESSIVKPRRVAKDGSGLNVSVTISPIYNEDNAVIGASVIARDVDDGLAIERERLEAQIHRSERLESLGKLAGGIAHDFNNLHAIILNYATFVEGELDNPIAAQADLAQIKVAAERASKLTRHLLTFARREVPQPQPINVNNVVASVAEFMRSTLAENFEIDINLAPSVWTIQADSGQLEQVLVNLSVNARDAMPDGGTLTIDTENIEIDEECAAAHLDLNPGRYVGVRVSDNGMGMEAHVLEHAFEPFFTTKSPDQATGLGLSMAFGVVAQTGGDIQLYSEIGVGTTCRILLRRLVHQTRPR